MKPLRMLGLGLAATLAMCAMAVLPAAANAQEVEISEPGHIVWEHFKYCPTEVPTHPEEREFCTWEQSEPTSSFKAGNIEIHLVNPITLQGGLRIPEANEEEGAFEQLQFKAAVGAPTLTPTLQPAPKLDEVIDPSKLSLYEFGQWTAAEHKAQNANHPFEVEEPTYVAIELAGQPEEVFLSLEHLLIESEKPTLTLPVKVHLISNFGGPNCYVGSNAEPIEIELATGQSGNLHGFAGHLLLADEAASEEYPSEPFSNHFEDIVARENSLVNETYASPEAKGCGLRGEADEALNSKLGLPSPSGNNNSIITGNVELTLSVWVKEHFPEGPGT